MNTKKELLKINIADIVQNTVSEGPGNRFAIWVQGCPIKCPGCCNPQFIPDRLSKLYSIDELIAEIPVDNVEGVTLLGGEPLYQAETLGFFAEKVKTIGLSVMVFTGYTFEEVKQLENTDLLLQHCDILVDGKYIETLKVDNQKWIGSSNQKIHYLSDLYKENQIVMDGKRAKNTIELSFYKGEIRVNGFAHTSFIKKGNRIERNR